MAVDATYMNLLPSQQFLANREIIRANNLLIQQQQQQQQQLQNQLLNSAMYNAQMNDSSAMAPQPPAAATTATTLIANNQQSLMMPFYQSNNVCDPNKSDSGLTYHHNNNNIPLQRKRSRDFAAEFTALPAQQKTKLSNPQQFINNQDALFQFQNQTQSEIDLVLAHHTEKVRMELEEQKIRQSRVLLSVLQDTMAKKLKEKDEEIQRMEKLNMALQERVKTLCVENQVWRELAQTNETTANYLRSNLEQVLAHVGEDRNGGAVLVADDAESCCESNDIGGGAAAETEGDTAETVVVGGNRMCRSCGVRESIVLLLPCRHLCLCTMCGSTIRNCPVCDSGMDASVHVNLA